MSRYTSEPHPFCITVDGDVHQTSYALLIRNSAWFKVLLEESKCREGPELDGLVQLAWDSVRDGPSNTIDVLFTTLHTNKREQSLSIKAMSYFQVVEEIWGYVLLIDISVYGDSTRKPKPATHSYYSPWLDFSVYIVPRGALEERIGEETVWNHIQSTTDPTMWHQWGVNRGGLDCLDFNCCRTDDLRCQIEALTNVGLNIVGEFRFYES